MLAAAPAAALLDTRNKGLAEKRDLRRLREDNRDDIEPDTVPRSRGLAGVFAGDAEHVKLLFVVNCAFWRAKIAAFSRFYLDKNEFFTLKCYQIGLCIARSQTIIARDNRESLPAEEAVREILAAAAQRQIRIPDPAAAMVAKPIRQNP